VKKFTTEQNVKIHEIFRREYGREMTPEERKMFGLVSETYPATDPEEEDNSAKSA
jgi:hypothetical protein